MIKPIKIRYKPIIPWSRAADLHFLATRLNEAITTINDLESRIIYIEKKLGIQISPAPKPD